MKHFYKPFLVLIFTITGCLSSLSWDFEVDGFYYDYYLTEGDQNVRIEGAKEKPKGSLIIPSTITRDGRTYTVTEIGLNAFKDCTEITELVMPNTIVNALGGAFQGCTSLRSVILSDILPSIDVGFFQDCVSLTSVNLPSHLTNIRFRAFEGCVSLKEIVIPDDVTWLDARAFAGCVSLEKVTFSKSLEKIGNEVFDGCGVLNDIILPESLYEIGSAVFSACSSLKQINIPDNVVSIGDRLFQYCNSLTEVKLSNSIIKIEEFTFQDCESLLSIRIPDSVEEIGWAAFYNCVSLEDVKLGSGLRFIAKNTFEYCRALKEITIPENISSIEDQTFKDCSSLTKVELPNGLTSIGWESFFQCYSLTDIELPDSLTTIHKSAFLDCSALTVVILPESLTYLGEMAFKRCTSLGGDIIISKNVEYVGGEAFQETNDIETATVEAKYLSERLFAGCPSLTKVILGEDVDTLKYGCLMSCTSLLEVECHAITPPECVDGFITDQDLSLITLYVPGRSLSLYETTYPWSEFGLILPLDNYIPVENVEIINPENETLNIGDTVLLTAVVNPDDAEYELAWESSDSEIASVSPEGLVSCKSEGTVMITVYIVSNPEISDSIELTILNEEIGGLWNVSEEINEEFTISNLSGNFVMRTSDANVVNRLKSGLYIINGKKVMIGK